VRASLSALLGLLSLLTMPVAVLGTRYFEQYELLHAGIAIPFAVVLALGAFQLARAARGYDALRLGRAGGTRAARAGRVLAWAGLWLAGASALSLAVWGLLEYQASR
jgi:hypothetical protein